ncbi:DNA-binding response regulator [Parasaccharibacter sp. TMW2.1882]|uniref:DNA-binding response regulator n=3 Tax=Acetobacteraceae TaxID=433 RepID=A0A7U7G6I2_9PROT|nr:MULTISPECIES: response regulator transcription factor [Acetobacteraceae]MUG79315.1 response regulator [Bombella sp. ESL0380]MUH02622.1 response regulator [Bombella sp. ESL0387]QGT74986.1 response regulator [Bombella sp. ESL0368]MBE1723121.1 response regulator transcription factor [Bombella apis]MBR9730928.1 response regulator transcription factor [Bombella apis]
MNAHHSILIVDDDDALRLLLAEQLGEEEAYRVEQAATIAAAREVMDHSSGGRTDILLLDVNLPDGDGRDFCAGLRERGIHIPIIMMTGSHDEDDVIRGLDAGANDYVAKPFRMGELKARLRAQLRLFENSEDVVFDIGPYVFHPARKQLVDQKKGQRIHLTEKETAILKYLYRAGGQPVERDVLLHEVWGYHASVTTHTLETHIYRLRQKIEPDHGRAGILLTEGGGYCLNPDL